MRLLVFLLLSCWRIVVSVSAESRKVNIRAVVGENPTLPCEVPDRSNGNIVVVEWSTLRLKENKSQLVFLYRNKQIATDNDPSFKNRVNLKDGQMKNGSVSLILNNVTFSDSGIYECFVVQRGTLGNTESINSISLSVHPSVGAVAGSPDEEVGGVVGLIVGLIGGTALIILCYVVAVNFQRLKKKSDHRPGSGSGRDKLLDPERQSEVT